MTTYRLFREVLESLPGHYEVRLSVDGEHPRPTRLGETVADVLDGMEDCDPDAEVRIVDDENWELTIHDRFDANEEEGWLLIHAYSERQADDSA